jgi:Fic family protein
MTHVSLLDPAIPPRESLEALVLEVSRAGGLVASLADATVRAVTDMARVAEVHYSLAIDGHRVHPLHIEQGIRGEFSDNASIRGLQREALAYLKAERFVGTRINDPATDPASPSFLRAVHWELYSRIPEEFRWVSNSGPDGPRLRITPGEFRATASTRDAPPPEMIDQFARKFGVVYAGARLSPVERVIAAAASHHRLLWIHPFTGGNGRVARLIAAASLQRAGIDGALGGPWSMARGLGRARERYRELLAAADARQRHELEGRDVLSARGLLEFSRFFLESCRDELHWMRRALQVEALVDRIAKYVGLRSAAMAPGGPLHVEAASLLRDACLRGEIARGEAGRITGMAASEARKILGSLVRERLLVSDSPKGPVRIAFPAHAAPYLFPDLYAGELVFRDEPRSVIEAA